MSFIWFKISINFTFSETLMSFNQYWGTHAKDQLNHSRKFDFAAFSAISLPLFFLYKLISNLICHPQMNYSRISHQRHHTLCNYCVQLLPVDIIVLRWIQVLATSLVSFFLLLGIQLSEYTSLFFHFLVEDIWLFSYWLETITIYE